MYLKQSQAHKQLLASVLSDFTLQLRGDKSRAEPVPHGKGGTIFLESQEQLIGV